MKLEALQAIMYSFKVGIGHIVIKSDILTIDQEVIMFSSDHSSLKIPWGLNDKFVYNLCMCSFFIQTNQEMH